MQKQSFTDDELEAIQNQKEASPYPYHFYTVTAYFKGKGLKNTSLTAIVRTNRAADIQPAIEKFMEKALSTTNLYIDKVDYRKLKSDLFIYDAGAFLADAPSN